MEVLPSPEAGAGVEAGEEVKPPSSPPRTPSSPHLSSPLSPVGEGSRVRVRIARLQMERSDKEHARKAEYEYKLEVKRLKLEGEFKLRQLESEEKIALAQVRSPPSDPGQPRAPPAQFDITRNISLVPPFRESEVDSYFSVFERIAATLNWPMEMWPLLLQCRLTGKAQEVVSALPLEDSVKYDCVKAAVQRAYELVPEAYRQKFRHHKKSPHKTFVEFAREKETLFDRWCMATGCDTFASLRDLVLVEEFKNSLPDRLVGYVTEQKVASLAQAAVLADKFVLTHKTAFTSAPATEPATWGASPSHSPRFATTPPRTQVESGSATIAIEQVML